MRCVITSYSIHYTKLYEAFTFVYCNINSFTKIITSHVDNDSAMFVYMKNNFAVNLAVILFEDNVNAADAMKKPVNVTEFLACEFLDAVLQLKVTTSYIDVSYNFV